METAGIDYNFSDFHICRSAGCLVKVWILDLLYMGCDLEFNFSYTILGDANVAGPRATLSSKGIDSSFIEVCCKGEQSSGVV